ncbi:adaptin N terminal region-domain-containing protein [Thamnocephalis sphaerospora]|uniref:AP complex subunit beta n=1 Tax=Thamnocephalis sphaerospora TaxID=78915 RepID=A0A4P9XMA3_9FUNG|nr:adaptin N terminal region-domain-containing protein [Thamnocephalis sphaerospora]|eukprot:RKP06491.1 adaptin N terminal region-domain-containing protein [Thamnocephalis sphaerospora]
MATFANIQLSDVERVVNDFIAAVRAPNYFASTRRGELTELRADLNSDERARRKETVKRVIAQMTIGKDVSSLFPDVLKNMQTDDLELKKLVYLYLMNYAKTQPELVILAVNTFVKDTSDRNPLIRALAIRTMGCIRVDKMLDFISEPLMKCLRDDNPYVRKTAAINVAKLYDLSPELAMDNGFIDVLKELVADSNPMVVANAVTALLDINESSTEGNVFTVDPVVLGKLLVAMNECTEWGQVAILTALADYTPSDEQDAVTVCERVLPRVQHANASVVLAAIKVLLVYSRYINNEEFTSQMLKKMTPPLVTLLSSAPEIQYVALRNINIILQKIPTLLGNEMRVFFCRYNDPPYVKLEKLEILVKLCNAQNIDNLLVELKEYANEVDVDFARRAVRVIGRCAVKIEEAAERCVNVLIELIRTRVNHVVQEAIIVIKDIFRKYPHQYEGVIPILSEHLDVLDEPEAKAALIWIMGEYADRIDNVASLLAQFLDSFKGEETQVQLQIVTAIVKLFLRRPSDGQDIVIRALEVATKETDSPDIRDRAYIYWRLLSSNPDAAKAVVLADRPPISTETGAVTTGLLDLFIRNLSTLASVYHKPPETFIGTGRIGADASTAQAISIPSTAEEVVAAAAAQVQKSAVEDLLDLDFGGESSPPPSAAAPASSHQSIMDLFDAPAPSALAPMGTTAAALSPASMAPPTSHGSTASGGGAMNDLLDVFGGSPAIGSSSTGSLQPTPSKPAKSDPFADLLG